jgi:hypothetical protein
MDDFATNVKSWEATKMAPEIEQKLDVLRQRARRIQKPGLVMNRQQEFQFAASAEARQRIKNRGRILAIALARGKSFAPALNSGPVIVTISSVPLANQSVGSTRCRA